MKRTNKVPHEPKPSPDAHFFRNRPGAFRGDRQAASDWAVEDMQSDHEASEAGLTVAPDL